MLTRFLRVALSLLCGPGTLSAAPCEVPTPTAPGTTMPPRAKGRKPETVSWRIARISCLAVSLLVNTILLSAVAPGAEPVDRTGLLTESVIFFAADGLRQDLVQEYAVHKLLPAMRELIQTGAQAAGDGLLTQAPPNTGAGWYTLATGAWPGVHGSTNNTFHVHGQPLANRTSSFTPGILQAETIAQAAERGGKKVAQIEWAGGRIGTINGPTIDFRSFFSGRGVTTNYVSPGDDEAFILSFGLQYDSAVGLGSIAPFPEAAPSAAIGWTNVPRSHSPPMQMRLRVLDFGTDTYGLNVYLYDSTNDRRTNYNRVLFSPTLDGADAVADLQHGQWADVKVTIVGGTLAGKTGGMLLKVEELSRDLSKVRLFHTSVTRANASWPTWPGEPGFTGDFEEFVATQFPTSTAADFAVLEAGIVSEETYVEQGLYWETAHHLLIAYIIKQHRPDLVLAGYPVTDEFSHQFLGLVSGYLPNGARNPAYDDAQLDGIRDHRIPEREGFIQRSYQGADKTLTLLQGLMPGKTTTFVASDHGFAPQFLAIDASKVLVDLGLLSTPQTSNCRPASGDTIGKAKACWAGGAVQIYLNLVGRDPAGGGYQQVAATEYDAVVAQIIAAFKALSDAHDWTHDGQPEGWKMIDRVYTRAEARYIPTSLDGTTDMAHPTRTGDVIAFAYPPYQYDGATPGQLVSLSHFFGQHGYVPDLQDRHANVNMRATLLAGGDTIRHTHVRDLRAIDIAPTIAYLMRIPLPQQAQGEVRLDMLKQQQRTTLVPLIGLNDFHGQLDPTTMRLDDLNVSVGGAAYLATMFDEEAAALSRRTLLFAAGDNVGASPPNSGLLQDLPAIDVENAWGLHATSYGNHEFDYGKQRLLQHLERANFPFLGANIVRERTGIPPWWVEGSRVFRFGTIDVGVIGIALESTPDLVSKSATAGLRFLPAIETIRAESRKLRHQGVHAQIVLIHEGSSVGQNVVDSVPAVPWAGPIVDIANAIQDTTVDAIIAGHTHRVSNMMVGKILVTEGLNAGASYSVLQLVVQGNDVEWAGGATRVAKNLGVAARADVQAIVDDANAQTADLRNQVIGTQAADILRDPERRSESAMGNLITDAMRQKYPDVDIALTNSGGFRADLVCLPPSAGEDACEITWGEMFAVLPFGNRTILITLTGAQLELALLNGVSPVCDVAIHTGRFPQVSGLVLNYTCSGTTPVITGMWLAPDGPGGTLTPIGPDDSVRLVTNDFMYTGGDGYSALSQGTEVQNPGDGLLEITIDFITANAPVAPLVEGRIVRIP